MEVEGLAGLLTTTLTIARELPHDAFLWFRGVADGTNTLLPKIMRDGKTAEQVFERERRLLTRFRQRSLPYWSAGYPQNDWEHLFAMQHYGMPIRLLDWSENLFVAAHFALAESSAVSAGRSPAVWCLDPIAWNRSMPVLSEYGDSVHVLTTSDEEVESYRPDTNKKRYRSPVAIFGTHNSSRIVAQRGTFMVWGSDVRPLEDFAVETDGALWKLIIGGDKAQLSSDLAAIGFRENNGFPRTPLLGNRTKPNRGLENLRWPLRKPSKLR
jgi:hypothetical protein